ncbi:hypothetical protein [Celeribacter ethanolicus]|uniref:HoxN/HupN/NixA family nickel/cobalt transporter n=1 Tax=Celeribacter ethanolicus TaxID=1758178 RepID=UPI00082A7FF5|nr:hypothetical protein [Celeribacter ethanolicus]
MRLASGRTGTWQTILFGLSGGLIPCPAAITVFILCLHLDKVALGLTLVSDFSIGLAATLVAVGIVAALSLKAISARTSRFDALMAAAWLSATYHFHTVTFRPIQRQMALFLFDYLHSLLILGLLRLHSFLFIRWYEMWYIHGSA